MTLKWPDILADGRHWSWSHRITGGLKCHGILTVTPPPVIFAFGLSLVVSLLWDSFIYCLSQLSIGVLPW